MLLTHEEIMKHVNPITKNKYIWSYTVAEDRVLKVTTEAHRASTEVYSNHFVETKLHGSAEVKMLTALKARRDTPVYIVHYYREENGNKKLSHSRIFFKSSTQLAPEIERICDPFDEKLADLDRQRRIQNEVNLKNHEWGIVKCKNCGKRFTFSPRKNINCPKCGEKFVYTAEDVEKKWR